MYKCMSRLGMLIRVTARAGGEGHTCLYCTREVTRGPRTWCSSLLIAIASDLPGELHDPILHGFSSLSSCSERLVS